MNKLLFLTSCFLTPLLVRADLVIEQKIDSAMLKGSMIYKIKGNRARMDMPNPMGGEITTLIDLASGDITTLMHAQKMAMKMNMKAAKTQMEAMQKAAGVDLAKAQAPKATGQKEKVGEWNAEIYEMDLGGTKSKVWAAKDYPNAKAVKDQLNKVAAASSMGGVNPAQFDVPGMIVKSETVTPQGTVTTTLVSAKEQPVAETEFTVPTGYQEMKMPTAPVGTPPAQP